MLRRHRTSPERGASSRVRILSQKTWRHDLEVGLCARARSPDARDGRDQPERLNDSITHNDIYTGRGGRATAGRTVEPGYTNLFNGSNLTGWKIGGPESFTVENGVIVAHGASSHLFYDGSLRDHAFRNFDLKLDVLARNRSNGGVYVLTEYQAQGT